MRSLLFALALFPVVSQAQVRAGLGVRLNTSSTIIMTDFGGSADVGAVSISVPIDIRDIVRIEPIAGYSSTSVESDNGDSDSRATTLGVIVSALVPADDVTLTAGVRVRNTRFSSEQSRDGDDDFDSRVDILGVGPLVGGEYAFSRRFSIGAEAGLEYQSFSYDLDDRFGGGDPDNPDVSSIQTTAAVAVRFFLF